MKKLKQNKGITLIALIITIIILLILAGVTINVLIGDNGLFKTAKESGEKYEQAGAREKLEAVLVELQADKIIKQEYNEQEYIDNKLTQNNMEIEGDIAIVDGWQFEIDRSVPKISEELSKLTKEDMLKPTIIKLDKNIGEGKIEIAIKLRNEEGAKITYSIKEKGTDQYLERIEKTTKLQHTFNGLQTGKRYEITIETENEKGTDSKTIDVALIIITINDPESLAVIEGSTQQIDYSVTPEVDNIVWTSSNESIVKVDNNGILTGIKPGEAVVRLTAEGVSKEFNVEVLGRLYGAAFAERSRNKCFWS